MANPKLAGFSALALIFSVLVPDEHITDLFNLFSYDCDDRDSLLRPLELVRGAVRPSLETLPAIPKRCTCYLPAVTTLKKHPLPSPKEITSLRAEHRLS